MASPAYPSMRLRYSVEDLIRGQADLDRVNQKLHDSGYSTTRIGCVNTGKLIPAVPTTGHPSPCAAAIFGLDETDSDTSETLTQTVESSSSSESPLPRSSSMISPDSDIPCKFQDCPIKGIPHNIGRYFHNGEQYENPQSPGFGVTLAGVMEEASNAFNRTVPPPEIVKAYLSVRRGTEEATKADLDLVRGYQKYHMWSPINSTPSTPWPRQQYPHKHGLQGQMPPGNESYLAEDGVTSVFDRDCEVWSVRTGGGGDHYKGLGSFSFEQEGKRPLSVSDFEDSDDEEIVPWPPLRTAASHSVTTMPLLSSVTAPSDNDVYDVDDEVSEAKDALYGPSNDSYISLSAMREMPRGGELMSDKLRLQERILRQVANEGLRQAETGQRFDKDHCTHQDRDLEILLGLMEALPQALDQGGSQSPLVGYETDNKRFSIAELSVLYDVQTVLQSEFRETIANATRQYVPTGLPVALAQLREKLSDMMAGRQAAVKADAECGFAVRGDE